MFLEYDPESDCGFIWIRDPKPGIVFHEVWPEECDGHIGLLLDEKKRLVGLEVLFASAHLDSEVLSQARPEPDS